MKKLVILSGAGISAESGISTFRDSDGLWENYDVSEVCDISAWPRNPGLMLRFYNERRAQLATVKPNAAHLAIASLEEDYDVTVVTQNVDNLHERAGSSHVIHLHGELMKMCSSRDVDNPRFWVNLPHEGWGETGLEVPAGTKADDGSLLRPYIVFFQENVPNIYDGIEAAREADIFVIIGTSLNVYPAAGLIEYLRPGVPVYLIDPKPTRSGGAHNIQQIVKGASEGMEELMKRI